MLSRTALYCLFIFVLCFAGCSRNPQDCPPALTSVSIIDREGMSETISQPDRLQQFEEIDFTSPQPYQRVLRIYSRDFNGNIQAYITSYHPNGQVRQYLEIINNRAFGAYMEWYQDGTAKLDANVIGGIADLTPAAEASWLFDGCNKVWDEKGNLAATIEYNKGILNGTSIYYHPCGKIWKRVPYRNGCIEGSFEIFLESGQLLQLTDYVSGLKHGKGFRYWSEGVLSADETYHQGLLTHAYYYNLCRELVAEVKEGHGFRAVFSKDFVCELHEIHHGVEEGIIKSFDKQQNIIKTFHIKNGVKHGEEIEYFSSQSKTPKRTRLLVNWVDGKIQGITKTWYENGSQESQREMSNNQKNGLLTAWYQDGSLMLIEEYDHDKLLKGKYFKKGEKTPVSEVVAGEGIATLFDATGNFLCKINYYNSKPQE